MYCFPPLALGRVLEIGNEQTEKGRQQASSHDKEYAPRRTSDLEHQESQRTGKKSNHPGSKRGGKSLHESEWRVEPADVRNASILKRSVELVCALVGVGSGVVDPLNVHVLA
jgi:hypothetical protein